MNNLIKKAEYFHNEYVRASNEEAQKDKEKLIERIHYQSKKIQEFEQSNRELSAINATNIQTIADYSIKIHNLTEIIKSQSKNTSEFLDWLIINNERLEAGAGIDVLKEFSKHFGE